MEWLDTSPTSAETQDGIWRVDEVTTVSWLRGWWHLRKMEGGELVGRGTFRSKEIAQDAVEGAK